MSHTKPATEADIDRVFGVIIAAKTSGGAHLTANDADALWRVLHASAKRDSVGTFKMLDDLIGIGNANREAWTTVRDRLLAEVAS